MHTPEQLEQQNRELFQQWLSKQGLWRQLRYGLLWSFGVAGYGKRLSMFVLRVAAIMLLLLLAGFKLRDSMLSTTTAQKQFKQQLGKNLHARDFELGDYKIGMFANKMLLGKLQAGGNPSAFYEVLNIEGLELPFDYFDFKLADMAQLDSLQVGKVDLFVKCGEIDDKQAAQSYASLFGAYDKMPEKIELKNLNLFWGEIFDARGMLVNCKASLSKHQNGWKLQLQGGELSFGPLHFMPLQSALVIITPQDLRIEQLTLGSPQRGNISLQGSIGSGSMPLLQMQFDFSNIAWGEFLKLHNADFISGKLSGKGQLVGSFNSQNGVLLNCKASLDKANPLTIGAQLKLVEIFNRWDSSYFDSSWRFESGSIEFRRRYGSAPEKKILLHELSNRQLSLSGELSMQQLGSGKPNDKHTAANVSGFLLERAANDIVEKYQQRYAYWLRVEPLLKSNKNAADASLANMKQQQIWSELASMDENCVGQLRISIARNFADKLAKLPDFAELQPEHLLLNFNYSGKLRGFGQAQAEELLYLSSQLAHEKLSDDK